jgi:hypothetical protein
MSRKTPESNSFVELKNTDLMLGRERENNKGMLYVPSSVQLAQSQKAISSSKPMIRRLHGLNHAGLGSLGACI